MVLKSAHSHPHPRRAPPAPHSRRRAILRAEPIIGYMTPRRREAVRGARLPQIIVLANRHDWLSAFSNELGVVLAVEQSSVWRCPSGRVVRTMLSMLNRVLAT